MHNPNVLVCRAGPALRRALPPVAWAKEIAVDESGEFSVESHWHRGLDWITVGPDNGWHCDWREMFAYVVVAGEGVLEVAVQQHRRPRALGVGAPRQYTRHRLRRGDFLLLWPMAAHRCLVRRGLRLVSRHPGTGASRRDLGLADVYEQEIAGLCLAAQASEKIPIDSQ